MKGSEGPTAEKLSDTPNPEGPTQGLAEATTIGLFEVDFGIAKLLDPEASDYAVEATATMARLMTPEYASPEQVKGEQITTATDVYSLGVVLYEPLTGHRPYRLTNRLPHDIVRIVCEEEPQRPSTVITRVMTIPNPQGGATVTITPEQVSRTREASPEKLRRRRSAARPSSA